MATGQANRIVHHLRWLAHGRADHARTDGQLLEGFINRQDEGDFEEIVRRHGPMVLGVCRRVLGNVHDAEDAFQATFMVLVRRARSVVPRDLVGNWLYGVACRVAHEAQARSSRRRAREKQVEDMPHPTTMPQDVAKDLGAVLDRELSRLPEKYRVPIVLCELEGRTRKEVARLLGVPEGTLSSRLATGRKMLAIRLAPHGLSLAGTALAAALSSDLAQAAVPGTLAVSTVKAAAAGAAQQAVALGLLSARAAALTEGVMKAMLISKLKTIAAVLLTIGMLTTGAGVMTLTADEPGPGQELAQRRKLVVMPEEGDAPNAAADRPRKIIILDPEDAQLLNRLEAVPEQDPQAVADDVYRFWVPQIQDWRVLPLVRDKEGWRFAQPQPVFEDWGKSLEQYHRNPRYKNQCLRCHQAQQLHKGAIDDFTREAWFWSRRQVHGGNIIVILLPRKSTPAGDREFLRRACLDVLGRTPTPLEMRYFLEDSDPHKHSKVIEKLVREGDGSYMLLQNKVSTARPVTRESRAEEYVKEKLGKKELSAEERKLLQKVLEFAEKNPGK
jgi:RNA polymerase sigma factor (sigma-70 family)